VLLLFLAAQSAAAPTDAVLTVTTNSDAVNGDVATATGLITNPGPDGISLREALQVTNNDPGHYTVRFAPTLERMRILVGSPLPPLTGGSVVVEGDTNADTAPDVTLRPSPEFPSGDAAGLQISSSGNRLHALALEGFAVGVEIRPISKPLPTHRTFADNMVGGVDIRDVRDGIKVAFYSLECGTTVNMPPCQTFNRWENIVITDNTVAARQSGIHVSLQDVVGDRAEGITITDNTVRLDNDGKPTGGPPIQIDEGGNTTKTVISDVVIARNSIEAVNPDGGILLAAGLQRSAANAIEHVRIADNSVHLAQVGECPSCQAVVVDAGSDWGAFPPSYPGYPDGNVIRDVEVSRNSASGSLAAGVRIQAGVDGGGSRNRIENVKVERNTIRSSILGKGVYVWVGLATPSTRPATGNRITAVIIDANRITNGKGRPEGDTDGRTAAGVVLVGGLNQGRKGVIRDVRITKNRIATSQVGIRVIGGLGSTARGNSVTCVRLAHNRVTGTRTVVSVQSNGVWRKFGRASGNRASLGGC
jgi:hypothetical protein